MVSPEVVAEWFRRQGHRVIRTPSSWWYEASARVYQAFPFHWSIRPGDGELEELLRAEHAIALRCTTPLDAPEGRVSYHVVCDDREYDLHRLDARARNAVRNGMQRARIEPVPLDRMAEEGWQLEVDTCSRQGRDVPLSREAWRRRYLAAAGLPGFEAWGALIDGKLAASLLCVRVDDWWEVLGQQSLSEYLPARVNNAVTYVFTQSMVQRPGVRAVFYTLQSLDAPPTVDQFKFHMGYTPRPVRQRVALHPWASRILGPAAHRVISGVLRRRPGSRLLGKAEGMLRFHLEGKLPAERQRWPTCLETKGAPGAKPHGAREGAGEPARAPSPSSGLRADRGPAAVVRGEPDHDTSGR
jgi:hypothetical protein